MQDNVRFWEKRRSAACFVWTCKPMSNASVVLFSCVSFVFGYEHNACLISSFFFFWRAALRFCCSKKSHTRARRRKVLHWWVEHILTPYGWCYGRGQMVFGNSRSEWLVYRCVALAMAAGSCCVESTGATDSTVKICDMCEPIGVFIFVVLS